MRLKEIFYRAPSLLANDLTDRPDLLFSESLDTRPTDIRLLARWFHTDHFGGARVRPSAFISAFAAEFSVRSLTPKSFAWVQTGGTLLPRALPACVTQDEMTRDWRAQHKVGTILMQPDQIEALIKAARNIPLAPTCDILFLADQKDNAADISAKLNETISALHPAAKLESFILNFEATGRFRKRQAPPLCALFYEAA